MEVHHISYGKKLLPLPIVLLLVLSVLSVNMVEVSAVEYPAIYMEPALITDSTLTPGTNFSVSIKTDYNGTDIWAWEFQTLSYNPNVLQGGIQGTDMWTGDGGNKTFDMAVENVVRDSEVIRVNGTLMTIETEGNDTWTGNGVKTTFDTTVKPLVVGEMRVYVNGTLMTRKTNGNDTWTGDGVTKMFNVTKKPLVVGEMRVYVNGTLQIPALQYTVDYSKGIIKLKTAPGVGAEIKATYKYGHYTVNYSEGTINFYTAPGVGADVEATYIYRQYAMDYTQGSITFMIAPNAGAKVEVTYLYGGITNGDLITKYKHSSAEYNGGTFNNTSGQLSYTYANFFYIPPQSIPVTSGPGTLATVTFTVVDKGTSDITLEAPVLAGGYEGEKYHIINDTMPDHIGHGYFSNLPSIYVDPPTIVDPNLMPGTNFTVSIFTNYYNETEDVWGWEFTLTYNPTVLEGIEITNGDLITTAKDPSALFLPGTFDNEAGKLSLTVANFSYTGTPLPVTSGPGTLATVTFKVVDRGESNITLGSETKLIGVTEEGAGDKYHIIDYTMPDQIRNGFFDNTVHDIAVTSVTASPDTVKMGEPVSINVTVTNEGSFSETFNVTAYYDSTAIGTQPVVDLVALGEATLPFTWDTTGVTPGNYTISAYATPVLDEGDTKDNTFNDCTVKIVKLPLASFTYSPENPVTDQEVTFNASLSTPNGGTITSYAWNFGDGDTTATADPITTHVYALSGTYNVTLTITDSEGLTDTTADIVTVEESPPGIPLLYVATAVAAAIIIAAIAFYFLKIKKPKPT